mgnify:CR=1 FL=1
MTRDRYGIPPGEPAGGWALHGDTHPCETVLAVRVPGEPQAKKRPRAGADGHFYTPRSTQDAETTLADAVRLALPRGWRPDGAWTYGVRVIFCTADPARRDSDNMLKLALAALNNVLWVDDSQVDEETVRVVRGALTPCTYLQAYRVAECPPRPPRRARAARTAQRGLTAEQVRARLRARAPGTRIAP